MTAMITKKMTIMRMIREEYDRMFALGVSMYGQMTAGSYCYIGPQVTMMMMMLLMVMMRMMMTMIWMITSTTTRI